VIRIGPAGWAYKDWNGIVYPPKKPKGFHPVRYLAAYFDTIEINSTFYGAPQASSAKTWAGLVAEHPRFRYTAKLLHSFTHERNATANDEQEFKSGIGPLADADRFGALLLQFPWSFRNDPENADYLVRVIKRFQEFPLVLEVRHISWAQPQISDLLAELGVGLCNIDQPLFNRSIKPGAEVTSSVGYVRLHGRNYQKWFSKTALSHERYDYLYTVDELEPWVDRIKEVGRKAKDMYAITNNHHVGKAIVNGLEIASLITGKPVAAPPPLRQHYPELDQFTQ